MCRAAVSAPLSLSPSLRPAPPSSLLLLWPDRAVPAVCVCWGRCDTERPARPECCRFSGPPRHSIRVRAAESCDSSNRGVPPPPFSSARGSHRFLWQERNCWENVDLIIRTWGERDLLDPSSVITGSNLLPPLLLLDPSTFILDPCAFILDPTR